MHTTVYRCTGSCHGVSPVAKDCGAAICDRYEKPLQAVTQCESCAAASAKEGKSHACGMCEPQ